MSWVNHFTDAGAILKLKLTPRLYSFKRGYYMYQLLQYQGPQLCPVVALRDHFSLPKLTPPFSRRILNVTITGDSFSRREWLKQNIARIGGKPEDFSCHSLRRDGATFAHSAGAPLELIQAQGDWCSLAVLVYLTRPIALRTQVAKLMASALCNC